MSSSRAARREPFHDSFDYGFTPDNTRKDGMLQKDSRADEEMESLMRQVRELEKLRRQNSKEVEEFEMTRGTKG